MEYFTWIVSTVWLKARVKSGLTCPITDTFALLFPNGGLCHTSTSLTCSKVKVDCSIEARVARSDRRAGWLYRGTLLGFRIVVLYRDSAPSSAPQPQTQWRGLRLPTTCALWRKFKKNPQTPPIDPFCTPACENRDSHGARKPWMQIAFLLCEPRFRGEILGETGRFAIVSNLCEMRRDG